MPPEIPYRRLPLRDLMTDAQKRAHDLVDHLNSTLGTRATDLRDLSRPLRKKSHYPTLMALQNALQKMVEMTNETGTLIEYLERQLNEIRDHAKRERLNRG